MFLFDNMICFKLGEVVKLVEVKMSDIVIIVNVLNCIINGESELCLNMERVFFRRDKSEG